MAATQKGLERSEPDNPRTRPANWKQSGGWTRPSGRAAPEQLPQALAWPDLFPAGGQVLHRADGVPDRSAPDADGGEQWCPGGRGLRHPHGHHHPHPGDHPACHRDLCRKHRSGHGTGHGRRRLGGSLAQASGDGGIQCPPCPARPAGTDLSAARSGLVRSALGLLGD